MKYKAENPAKKKELAKDGAPNNVAVSRLKPFILIFLLIGIPVALFHAFSWYMYVCRLPAGTTAVSPYSFPQRSRLGEYFYSSGLVLRHPWLKPYLDYRHYTIPEGTVEIGERAFSNSDVRDGLRSVRLPGSLKTIGDYAFARCDKLTDIVIPDSVESIGVRAFKHCPGLRGIVIPGSVKSFSCFAECTGLRKVVIRDGVKAIHAEAFSGCTALRTIEIPDSVEFISQAAFLNCTSLEEIRIPAGMARQLIPEGKVRLASDPRPAVTTGPGPIVSPRSLAGCTGLKKVTLPDGIKTIGAGAFMNCISLSEINLPDNEGRIAIHYAVMSGNEKLVESLLKLGSDPNKLTKRKETPLHFAAKYSGLGEVKFLLEHGACIKAINWALVENLKEQRRRQDRLYYDSDEEHIIALKSALGLKTPEALQEEDDEEDDEDEDDDGGERYADTVDVEESSPGKKNVSKQILLDLDNIPVNLLPRDVSDAADQDGMTALHFAAQNGNTDVVRFLLENGADIKAQDIKLERAAIHFAAENGSLECVKFLTEHGADLLDRDIYGATALHYAAENNHLDVIKYLVSKKLDYTAKDARGWTAMHYAACGGSLDVIKYLLAKGLNINELNSSGRTPIFFARGNRELRKFMIQNGAK